MSEQVHATKLQFNGKVKSYESSGPLLLEHIPVSAHEATRSMATPSGWDASLLPVPKFKKGLGTSVYIVKITSSKK